MMAAGDLVKAEFDYDAKDDDEISFKEGDIITIVKWQSDGWCSGRLRGKTGLFPTNFVKKHERAPAPPPPVKPPKVRNNPGFGNIFADSKGSPLLQKVQQRAEQYDKKDTPVALPIAPSRPARDKPSKKKLCQCLFEYKADREDELDISEGDIITILDENAMEGWWKGSFHGKEGLFPNNFVKIMEDQANENDVIQPDIPRTPVATPTTDKGNVNLDIVVETPVLSNLTRNRPAKVKSTPPSRGSLHNDVTEDVFDGLQDETNNDQPVVDSEKKSDAPVSNADGMSSEKSKKENDRDNKQDSKQDLPPWSKYMKKPMKHPMPDTTSIDGKSKSQTLPIKKAKPNLPTSNYSVAQPVKEPILAKASSNVFTDSDKKANQEEIATLKDEIKSLRDEMEKMRKNFELTVNGLRKEVDEQKKMTVTMQVDVNRIREKLYPC